MNIAVYTERNILPDFCRSFKEEIHFTMNAEPGQAEKAGLFFVFGKDQFERNKEILIGRKTPVLLFDELNKLDSYNFPETCLIGRTVSWLTLLESNTWEICVTNEKDKDEWSGIMKKLNKQVRFVKDITGLITPRFLTCIVNEAYYTFGDGISTKDEIDTAMKLGTNYPKGPFEWSKEIGLKKIYTLLMKLNSENSIYTPAPAMENEIQLMK